MRRTLLIFLAAGAILGFSARDMAAGSCNLPPNAVDDNAGHVGAPLPVDAVNGRKVGRRRQREGRAVPLLSRRKEILLPKLKQSCDRLPSWF
jgi:hypothetical protein